MNDRDADTALAEDEWSFLRNAEFSRDGSIVTRQGCFRTHKNKINSGAQFLLDQYYQLDDGTTDRLVVVGDTLYRYANASYSSIQSGFNTTNYWSAFQLSNQVILGNGIDPSKRWNGTTLVNLSIASAPQDNTATFTATVGAGGELQVGAYRYSYTYRNSTTLEESNPVQRTLSGHDVPLIVSATTTAGNQTITLSNFIASADPQVDQIVIYRTTAGSQGPLYEIGTKANSVANFVDPGLLDGTHELVYDNDVAPNSAINATFLSRGYYAVNDTVYYSKEFIPGSVPADQFFKLGRDGQPITCLLNIGNNALLIGKRRSIYILTDDPATGAVPQIFNSLHGVLNNRSASVFDNSVFFIDQSLRPYMLDPTELANRERRVVYIGRRLANTFAAVSKTTTATKHIKCESLIIEDKKQWLVSIPLTSTSKTDAVCVLDLMAPIKEGADEPGAWSVNTVWSAGTLKVWPDADGIPRLYRGDFNGFMWQHLLTYGDGAQLNGTSTGSNTSTTLNDTGQTWTVNDLIGVDVLITGGTGSGQRSTITANTATQLTVSPAWVTTPTSSSTYSIGGIDFQAFTNWKRFNNHDDIKRLWFLWFNFSKTGNYGATLYVQRDFDTSIANSTTLTILQTITNSQWGTMIWGQDIWGGLSSTREKVQLDLYYNHLRLGIVNQNAGQPIVLNGFSNSSQQKGLFTA